VCLSFVMGLCMLDLCVLIGGVDVGVCPVFISMVYVWVRDVRDLGQGCVL